MIGLDTSHVIEFNRIFGNIEANPELAETKIVAGFPGRSDLPISRERVAGFTRELAAAGLEIVDSVHDLLERVDAVMLTSVDGGVHLEQARPVLEAGKRLFIDKPLAHRASDAREIMRLSELHGTPCFSSSCVRFSPQLIELEDSREVGDVTGAATWGTCHEQPGVPDLFFYGIHGIEALFAVMGQGCESVQRIHHRGVDLVIGTWSEGRLGVYRGLRRDDSLFGATIFGSKQIAHIDLGIPYRELCIEIARFFRSGVPPVRLEESIEILAFMEAANESWRQGGAVVRI